MSFTHSGLQRMLSTVDEESRRLRLEINVKKTKVMVVGRADELVAATLDGMKLEPR